MLSRIEEVVSLLAESKSRLEKTIIQICNADSQELYLKKFAEFDIELNRYSQLRIEMHGLGEKFGPFRAS